LIFLLREDAPTFLDRVNLCEKLGAIPSAKSLIEIRDLRNTIAHEYAVDDLLDLYAETLSLSPELLEAAKAAEAFARSRMSL